MAGRGRNQTIPSWMTVDGSAGVREEESSKSSLPGQFDDANGNDRDRRNRSSSRERDADRRGGSRRRERSRSRDRGSRSSNRRDDDRDRNRDRDRDRRRERRSPSGERYIWKSRKELGRSSNFDVQPMVGMEPAPIAVIGGASHSHTHGSSKTASQHIPASRSGGQPSSYGPGASGGSVQDRHARRLYVGNLPPSASKDDIIMFLEDVLKKTAPQNNPYVGGNGKTVMSAMLNHGNTFCFVEFANMEVTCAALNLDGVQMTCGQEIKNLRMKRPNDFKPELVTGMGPIPILNLNADGVIVKLMIQQVGGASGQGPRSTTGGPGKIFIGGLPYNLSDSDVEQLLTAFGPIRSFNLVRDPGSETSKGFGFCEYMDMATTQAAIDGLNGIAIGEKALTVKMAGEKGPNPNTNGSQQSIPVQQQQFNQYQGGGIMPPQMGQQQPPIGMPSGGRGQAMTMPAWMTNNNPTLGAVPVSSAYGQQPPPPVQPYGQPMHIPQPQTMYAQPQTMYAQPAVPHTTTTAPIHSRVLKLSNMVSREEIQDDSEFVDIREDVQSECAGYGQVLGVLIPRVKEGFPLHTEGSIYVEFQNTTMAAAAKMALSGRKFAGNTLVVENFGEEQFRQRNF